MQLAVKRTSDEDSKSFRRGSPWLAVTLGCVVTVL